MIMMIMMMLMMIMIMMMMLMMMMMMMMIMVVVMMMMMMMMMLMMMLMIMMMLMMMMMVMMIMVVVMMMMMMIMLMMMMMIMKMLMMMMLMMMTIMIMMIMIMMMSDDICKGDKIEGDRKECRICNNLVGRTNYAKYVRNCEQRNDVQEERAVQGGGGEIRSDKYTDGEKIHSNENGMHTLQRKCNCCQSSKTLKIESLHGFGQTTASLMPNAEK